MDNQDTNKVPGEKLDKSLVKKPDLEQVLVGLQAVISTKSSGPLPRPEILKAYDLVKPGLAGEIVDMAQRQSRHRMEMENTVIVGDSKRAWIGLILGFLLASGCIGCSTYLIANGHDLAGGLFAGSTIVSLTGVFVYGTNQRAQERTEKLKTLLEASTDDDQD